MKLDDEVTNGDSTDRNEISREVNMETNSETSKDGSDHQDNIEVSMDANIEVSMDGADRQDDMEVSIGATMKVSMDGADHQDDTKVSMGANMEVSMIGAERQGVNEVSMDTNKEVSTDEERRVINEVSMEGDISFSENERKHASTGYSPVSLYMDREEDCPLNKDGIPVHIDIPDWLKGSERERFLALLRKYNGCFTRNYGEPGLTNKCEFSIDTGDHAPINEKMRPTNPAQRKALKAELEELSRYKIIKPSFGPWSSHVVMVGKPGGGIRMVLDSGK